MVSIIIPVKNTAKYLVECLDSIVNQDMSDWECILVNDHSTDHSLNILESYANLDNRFKVLNNVEQGITPALIFGYEKVKGDFITRMDSDDIMTVNKLRLMKDVLENKGTGHVAVGLVEYFSGNELGDGYKNYEAWLNRLTIKETNYSEIYKECVIPSPCWMVHRSDFDKAGGFNATQYPEDYDLTFRFRKAGLKIAAVPERLHLWRDHGERVSRNSEHYRDNSFIDIKVKYFVEEDFNANEELVLWGAGTKGKMIAKALKGRSIPFRWVCENPNKIGHNIYDVILESPTNVSGQVIVAVAMRQEQDLISDQLNHLRSNDIFYFC